jgi:hypothetical protein
VAEAAPKKRTKRKSKTAGVAPAKRGRKASKIAKAEKTEEA